MSDDLIKRLQRADEYEPLGHDGWEAATALAEAHATIARQQALLDRALESNGELMVRIGKLEAALRVNALRAGFSHTDVDRVIAECAAPGTGEGGVMARVTLAIVLMLLPGAVLLWSMSRECAAGFAWREGWLPEYVDTCAKTPDTPG